MLTLFYLFFCFTKLHCKLKVYILRRHCEFHVQPKKNLAIYCQTNPLAHCMPHTIWSSSRPRDAQMSVVNKYTMVPALYIASRAYMICGGSSSVRFEWCDVHSSLPLLRWFASAIVSRPHAAANVAVAFLRFVVFFILLTLGVDCALDHMWIAEERWRGDLCVYVCVCLSNGLSSELVACDALWTRMVTHEIIGTKRYGRHGMAGVVVPFVRGLPHSIRDKRTCFSECRALCRSVTSGVPREDRRCEWMSRNARCALQRGGEATRVIFGLESGAVFLSDLGCRGVCVCLPFFLPFSLRGCWNNYHSTRVGGFRVNSSLTTTPYAPVMATHM